MPLDLSNVFTGLANNVTEVTANAALAGAFTISTNAAGQASLFYEIDESIPNPDVQLSNMAQQIRNNEGREALLRLSSAVSAWMDNCLKTALINKFQRWAELWAMLPQLFYYSIQPIEVLPAHMKPFDGDPVQSIEQCMLTAANKEPQHHAKQNTIIQCVASKLNGVKDLLYQCQTSFFKNLNLTQNSGVCFASSQGKAKDTLKESSKYENEDQHCEDYESGTPVCAREICEQVKFNVQRFKEIKKLDQWINDNAKVFTPCYTAHAPNKEAGNSAAKEKASKERTPSASKRRSYKRR